jgi:SprT protein
LQIFLAKHIFPDDVRLVLEQTHNNMGASTCADDKLMRVLKKYDTHNTHLVMVESLPMDSFFDAGNKRIFQKGEKIRKRFRCKEISTGKLYLFSPIFEVIPLVTT